MFHTVSQGIQWHWVPIAHSSNLIINIPVSTVFPSLYHFPHSPTRVSWGTLQSWPQILLLRISNLIEKIFIYPSIHSFMYVTGPLCISDEHRKRFPVGLRKWELSFSQQVFSWSTMIPASYQESGRRWVQMKIETFYHVCPMYQALYSTCILFFYAHNDSVKYY